MNQHSVRLMLVASLLIRAICAQTASTGALTGRVTDPSGAVVPDAAVKVVNLATNEARELRTAPDGGFSVPLLPPGNYRLEVSKSGFTTALVNSVGVSVTETSDVPIHLELGTEARTVEVRSAAEVVQTDSSALGRVVSERTVQNLPLVARNYTQIIGLSPGVTGNITNAGDLGRGSGGLGGTPGVGFNTNGDYSYDNNFQLNGLQVNDVFEQGTTSGGVPIPSPDSIQEFKVQTGQYDAAFGRNAGANVNVITRGGGNEFHGDLFEFFRNTDLNGNNFFSNMNGQPRAVLNQNQFGATMGGPIRKNKLLFFGSYQGTRQVNGVSSVKTVLGVPLTNDRSAQGIANVLYGPGSTVADRRGTLQNAMGGVGPAILAGRIQHQSNRFADSEFEAARRRLSDSHASDGQFHGFAVNAWVVHFQHAVEFRRRSVHGERRFSGERHPNIGGTILSRQQQPASRVPGRKRARLPARYW